MNDLQTLHAALAQDEPSQDVVDRSRHRLQNRIVGGPASGKRTRWLVVGTGLTVAAAAVAVAISVVPGAPADSPQKHASTGTRTVTGQEILLAAATGAEREPTTSGTYWHIKVTITGPHRVTEVYEYWTKADGQYWFRGVKTNNKAQQWGGPSPNPFSLVGAQLTLDQLRALPTDPEELKAAIAYAIEHGDSRTSAGPLKDVPEFLAQAKFDSLISLVSGLPATPAVRAAAFRAIASYPGVQSLGSVPGGQGLLLPGGQRFVVDPRTGRVNGTSTFVAPGGGNYSVSDGSAKITAEWTDTLPS
jgi:hypothetical protein